jgi:hypothetical protein
MGQRPVPERILSVRFRARRAREVPISHPCLRMSSSHPFVLVVETTNDRSKDDPSGPRPCLGGRESGAVERPVVCLLGLTRPLRLAIEQIEGISAPQAITQV